MRFDLRGANRDAFDSKEPEVLLAGPAGSGKSLAWLLKIFTICNNHAGARCLIARKTRESLTESVLVTWERDVLAPGTLGHSILTKNPTLRRVRQSYRFPNGSTVVVGGMDKPDKVLSSEWDFIYCPESTDLELVDWETLGGRLRAGRVPFQQLAGDCNPGSPHHFLYKRHQTGMLKLYSSTHKENPRYFKNGEWTDEGRMYLARLERMTGARRDRFLLGKWVAAEGVVYAFDPDIHQHPKGWVPPADWPRVWGIDWGESSPTVLGMWAVDPEGRIHHYRESYQTHMRADKLGAWARGEVDAGREPKPYAIVCDHDLEKKADFELTSRMPLTMAEKQDRDKGIQAMQARFDVQADGQPRIYLTDGSLAHEPDRSLVDSGRPCSSIEEIVGYCWNPDFLKDEPIADNDHWDDQARYVVVFCDKHFAGPHSKAAADAYSPPRKVPGNVDRVTGLPKSIFS